MWILMLIKIGEFDLSTMLPLNTQALLDMKKSYGFYLNRFLSEYDRMKRLNSVIYREKIQSCYKTQNLIASELCACVETLMSVMDMYSGDTPDTPSGNQYEKPKDGNDNKINNEENKINENKIEIEQKDDNLNKINDKEEEKKLFKHKFKILILVF